MKTIARWLRQMAAWCDPVPRSRYAEAATEKVAKWNATLSEDFWEAKRKRVMVELMAQFPEARKRDLGYAIEQVLQDY